MKKIIFVFICLISFLYQETEAKTQIDSLLEEVDLRIERKPQYLAEKMRRIENLKTKIALARSDSERFDDSYRLFQEYRTFSMDTSLLIARQCRQTASSIDSDSIKWLALIMEAEAQKGMGLYDQSLGILGSLPPGAREMFKSRIFNRYVSIYYSLYDHTYPRNDAESGFPTKTAMKR